MSKLISIGGKTEARIFQTETGLSDEEVKVFEKNLIALIGQLIQETHTGKLFLQK